MRPDRIRGIIDLPSRNLLLVFFATVFFAVGFFVFPHSAQAAVRTWDGGGTDGTCGGGAGDGNKWSCAANWSSDTTPTSADTVVFDGTSTKDATIDTAVTSLGIAVNSGYSGTITQGTGITVTTTGTATGDLVISSGTFNASNGTITISDAFTVSGGIFTGGSGTIDINGAYTLSSGTFTSTSGTMTVAGAFTISGGTFNESTGTVSPDGGSSTWNVVTSETFNNFTIAKNNGNTVTITSGDTLIVTGTLTLTNGNVNTGTIDARGTISQASTFDGGTGTIDFGDDGVAQTYTVSGGGVPNVRFDSAADASDSLTFTSAVPTAITGVTITSGFSGTVPLVNASNFTLPFDLWSQAAGTYDASAQSAWSIGVLTISGGTFTPPATVTADANATWNVDVTETFNNLTRNASGGLTITSGDTLIVTGTLTLTNGSLNTGTVDTRGSISQASGFDGGTATIDFGDDAGSDTYTINGGASPIIEFDSAADANDLVTFAANPANTSASFSITSGFSGAIPISNASNFTLTIDSWNQAAGTYDASAQSAWNIVNFVRSAGTFTAPALVTVTSAGSDWDFPTSQTFANFTVDRTSGNALDLSDDTLIATGNLILEDGVFISGTIDVAGSITQNADMDSGSTGTIDFGDDAGSDTYTINGGHSPVIEFDSAADANDLLTFASNALSVQVSITAGFSGAIPITNPSDFVLPIRAWTQAAGTYNASTQTAWQIQTLTITGGTLTMPTLVTANLGASTFNVNTTQTFTNLTVSKTASNSLNISSGDSLVISGTLLLTEGEVNGGTLEPHGDVSVASTFDGGSTTLNFGGSSNQAFDLTGAIGNYNGDITVTKTGGQVNLASALDMDAASQDLTIAEGVLDLVGHALNVDGSGGSFTVQDGGVLELFGAEAITLNASNPTLQSGSTVRFTGDGDAASDTYTVTTLKNAYHHLTINSTDGATDTFQLGSAIDLNGNFTLTAGTFNVTGSNHAMTVAGNWANTGTFQAQSGTVTFDGTNQSITGSTTFNNFVKAVTSAATLTFAAGATQVFAGSMTLTGSSTSTRLSLRSDNPGTRAKINPQGSRTVQNLDVQDNDNDNATAITCNVGCFDSGNNENWLLPGIQVSVISGNTTEAGGTATFSVVLGSEPTGDVTIPVSSSDTTEGTVAITELVFTNANFDTPQIVTVTGQNDDVDDGDIAYSIVLGAATSTDPAYDTVNPADVSVTNTDNDTVGVTVSLISGDTTEGGGTATFTVVLNSEPTGNVVVASVSNDATEGVVTTGASLTFTTANWDTPQTVTVTGQDDALTDGDIDYSITTTTTDGTTVDPLYDPINPDDVAVTNLDNETPGISVVTIDTATSEGGGTGEFTVVLTTEPTDDVTVPISSDDTTEGTVAITELVFTDANWDTPQSVTVTGVNDAIDDGDVAYNIIVGTAVSDDPAYNGFNPSDVAMSNTDNDTAGFDISAISGNTTEGGGTATFTIDLRTEPVGTVEIDAVSNDSTEGVVTSGGTLTFNNVNWNTPQTVTITGQDDIIDDGNIVYSIVNTIDTGNTTDAVYDALNPADVSVTNEDNDAVEVIVTPTDVSTSETGNIGDFDVVLGAQPSGNVVINSVSGDLTEGNVETGAVLTFTTANWDTPQTVTVRGVNDVIDDGDVDFDILVTVDTGATADPAYDALEPDDVTMTNVDNDTSGVTVGTISGHTTEGGGTATFTLVLNTQPSGNVEIDSVTNDATEGVVTNNATVTFTNGNWNIPQTVTVTGQDDFASDGDITYSIVTTIDAGNTADPLYDPVNPNDVSVINDDDDTADVIVSTISGPTTENGGTATFTVVLDSLPDGDVEIDSVSSDLTEGVVTSGATLTFTTANWFTPQTVTVTGQDDAINDGNIGYTIFVTLDQANTDDNEYDTVEPDDVAASNSDNEVAGVTVSAISGNTTEAGGTATFTVVLDTQPGGTVEIDSVSNDATEGVVTSGGTLTFNDGNWFTPQTVTVTGQNDSLDDGNVGYTIVVSVDTGNTTVAAYDLINPNDVSVTNTDNDTSGFTVSAISGNTTEAGGTATFTVVLTAQPTDDVSFDIDSSDATEGITDLDSLTFTELNWNTPRTVTVTGQDDALDDGDIAYSIILAAATSADSNYNGLNPNDVSVTNTDNDTVGVTVSAISGPTTENGGTATFTVVLDGQPTGNVEIDSVSNDATEGVVTSNSTITFTTLNWDTPQTVTVTGQDDGLADGDIAYSIVVTVDAGNTADPAYDVINPNDVSVSNVDNDSVGITVSSISGNTTEAGGTATFSVVLNTQPTDDVTVPVSSNDTSEGTVAISSLTFTDADWDTPQTVTVTGVNDDIDDGNILYTILLAPATSADGAYDTFDADDVSVTNNDNDTADVIVSAISGNTTEAGGTATFTVVLATQPTGSVQIDSVTNDSSEGVVTSGANLTFSTVNWATPQTVTVTGQNDALDDGNIAYSIVVTVNAGATADAIYDAINPDDVAVSNTDNDTVGVTITQSGGTTTVVEGGATDSYTVVLTAQPSASVFITLNDDGEVDPSASVLTFTTGNWDTPQSVTVTAVDDADVEGVHSGVINHTAASGDPQYDGITVASVTASITDNDTGGGGNTTPEIPPVGEPPDDEDEEDEEDDENDITVTFPNGGESFTADEETIISWEARGPEMTTVNIALSTDGGATFNTFATNEANDGFYFWTVPDVNTQNARILIEGTDGATLLAYDVSNNVFTIVGTPEPEPGEEPPVDENGNPIPGSGTGIIDTNDNGIPDVEEVFAPSEIQAGDYIKGVSFATVFWIDENLVRHPFYDEQTFFTYEDTFDVVKKVADSNLPVFPVGTPRLPKPGSILVKIKSQPHIYHVRFGDNGEFVLHWIPSEELAEYLVGPDWPAKVIDLPPTVWMHYAHGRELTAADTIDRSLFVATREELNSH